jgi:peptidoglycan hydrolase-like protein with peptidoglycan-binding domain
MFVVGAAALAPDLSFAATLPFTADLKYGMYGSGAVGQLQDFLRAEGYFNHDSTGNFLSATLASVKAWQAAHCVPATGYFGPLSREAAAAGTLCTAVQPASAGTSGESAIVAVGGVAYVRTENGLVRITGGAPSHHSSYDSAPPAPVTYAVTSSGDGNESISPNTAQTIEEGSTLALTVTADSGYTLSDTVGGTCLAGSWSGSVYTTGAITADCTVSFSATQDTYALTVTKAGPGSGSITSTPAGIACGPTCSATFPSGTMVTLTAFATDGFFNGWSGSGCSGLGTCTVTMDAAKAVTATFQTLEPS